MLATDGSDSADEALDLAIEIARDAGATLASLGPPAEAFDARRGAAACRRGARWCQRIADAAATRARSGRRRGDVRRRTRRRRDEHRRCCRARGRRPARRRLARTLPVRGTGPWERRPGTGPQLAGAGDGRAPGRVGAAVSPARDRVDAGRSRLSSPGRCSSNRAPRRPRCTGELRESTRHDRRHHRWRRRRPRDSGCSFVEAGRGRGLPPPRGALRWQPSTSSRRIPRRASPAAPSRSQRATTTSSAASGVRPCRAHTARTRARPRASRSRASPARPPRTSSSRSMRRMRRRRRGARPRSPSGLAS